MLPLLPCFKVLPLVFDESLSYYECVCKLIKCLQDVAQNCDSNFQNQQKEIEDIIKRLEELKQYIDDKTSGITDGFDEKIQNAYNDSISYTDMRYEQLINILKINNEDVYKWVKQMIDNIPNAFAPQFIITGDPKTSGIKQDYQTCIRESQFDFVDCNRWNVSTFENIGMTAGMLSEIFTNVYEFDTKRLNNKPRSYFTSSSNKRNAKSFWFKSSDIDYIGSSSSSNGTLRIILEGKMSISDSSDTRLMIEVSRDNEKLYFKYSRLSPTIFDVVETLETLEFPYHEVWIGLSYSTQLNSDKVIIMKTPETDNQELYNDSFMNYDVQHTIISHIYQAKLSSFSMRKGSSEISSNQYRYYLHYMP